MGRRVGIELSPLTCRVVVTDGAAPGQDETTETRVQSFFAMPVANPAMRERLKKLRNSRITAVVWGAASEHRQVEVEHGSYEAMRAEAIGRLTDLTGGAPIDVRRVLADIAPLDRHARGVRRRRVLLAVADASAVRAALKTVEGVGIRPHAVLTPPLALMALARTRRSLGVPDALEAYVALEETATSMAIVRDGWLVAARDLPWGYLGERGGQRQPRPREEIVYRLGEALTVLFDAVSDAGSVVQILVCGGLPDLRTTTVPLMERFDIEVETLDSLTGIDAARLPEPVDEFRDRLAELRMAWAAAAEARPPVDLVHSVRRRATRTRLARVAVVAGVAAGVGAGVGIERSGWWQTMTAVTPHPAASAQRHPQPRPSSPLPATRPQAAGTAASATDSGATPPAGATAAPAAAPPGTTPAPSVRTPPPAAATARSAASAPAAPRAASPPPAATTARSVAPAPAAPRAASPPPAATTARSAASAPAAPRPASPSAASPTGSTRAVAQPAQPTAPARAVVPPPPARAVAAPAPPPPAAARSRPPSRPAAPPAPPTAPAEAAARATPPASTPSPRAAVAASRGAESPPAREAPAPPARSESATAGRAAAPAASPAAPVARRAGPPPLPFDAALSSILYGPDRQLAIVDGQIVQRGDRVKGARVVEITPTSVLLRDERGRLRELTLASGGS